MTMRIVGGGVSRSAPDFCPKISDGDWAEIEDELSLSLSPEIRVRIIRSIQRLAWLWGVFERSPRASQFRGRNDPLKGFDKALSQGIEHYDALRAPDDSTASKAWLHVESYLGRVMPGVNLSDVVAGMYGIRSAIQQFRDSLPEDPGGRTKNPALDDFIYQLAELFEEVSECGAKVYSNEYRETDPYATPFFEFVQCFIKFLPGEIQIPDSHLGIGQWLQRALESRSQATKAE